MGKRIAIFPKLSLAHKVVVGFGIAFFMVLAFAILADANRQRQLDADHSIAHTHSLIDELELTLSIIKDNETGMRGYVITGEDTYLEPYYEALGSINVRVKSLRALVEGDTIQQDLLRQLEPRVERRLDISREVVSLRRKEGFEAAQNRILLGDGKVEMNAVRSLIAQMQSLGRADLAELSKQSEINAIGTGWMLLAVPFCLAFIAFIYLQIRGEMRARQNAEQALIASESKFKAIVENTSDAIYMKDVQGRYTMMNRAGASLFNMSSEEIVGLTDIEFVGEAKGRRIMEKDRQVLEGGPA